MANPQALNRYAYTLNNPLRYTDPTGHFFIPIAAMAVTGAIGMGAGFVGSVVGQVAGNLIAGASLLSVRSFLGRVRRIGRQFGIDRDRVV